MDAPSLLAGTCDLFSGTLSQFAYGKSMPISYRGCFQRMH